MKKFMILEHRDSARMYKNALLANGYGITADPERADFLLYDLERASYKETIDKFLNRKPMFIYPHSALSWYMWDGIHIPNKVSCNFVFSEKIKEGMKTYGYPYRVEACGFTGCEIKEWQPTSGKVLLYTPIHSLGKKRMRLVRSGDLHLNKRTLEHVIRNVSLFDKVIIRYGESFEACGLRDPKIRKIKFESSPLTVSSSLEAISRADIIITCGTFGYLSVAQGKPTIFFNQSGTAPSEFSWTVKTYDKYRWIDYPVQFKDMSGRDVIRFASRRDDRVEEWKKMNIGSPFDANKFLSIIKEYV